MNIRTLRSSARRTLLAGALLVLAAASQSLGALIHDYDLNGSYADNLGGPSLAPNGGTLNPTNYSFGPQQGLTLSGAIATPDNYSILIDFSLANLTGYRRILDFKNGLSDTGLYNLNTGAAFYNVAFGPAGAFALNTEARLVLTRDGVTDLVTAYVNGVAQFSFVDAPNIAVFDAPGNIMKFFIDDSVFPGETSAGQVGKISIFDSALTAADVAGLGGPGTPIAPGTAVPEPGSALVGMLALGLCGTRLALRSRKLSATVESRGLGGAHSVARPA